VAVLDSSAVLLEPHDPRAIMNVAQLFYAKHPRQREKVRPGLRQRRPRRLRPFLYEPLEERLLLSASPLEKEVGVS
jgi:hypothetical protein